MSFRIRLDSTPAEEEMGGRTQPVFRPQFKDQDQTRRFEEAIRGFAAYNELGAKAKDFTVRQSHITVPLGIALYRLHLWSQSIPSSPPASVDQEKGPAKGKGNQSKP